MADIAKRVFKNTGYLYIKMGITVFVSLFTTRIILASLGASDFGLFNIVGGVISMLGFLNSTMAHATQRFMSYAEGKGCLDEKRKVFNVSFVFHVFIAILTLLFLLIAMPFLFDGILNIPEERINVAKIVYLCVIFSTLLTIINVPYDAIMNAHENMLYYSIIGVFESLLKLSIAIICFYTIFDKLIVYGFLMAVVPLITLSIMKIYCHQHYEECFFSFKKYVDFGLAKKIMSFSGWNFLTAITSLFSAQGIGVVLNHFFGTTLNASQGIAHQINGQLSAFSSNMMKAFNPIIVKEAGGGKIEKMNMTVIAGCKFSAILIIFFAVPFIIEMPYILNLWLSNVPDWTVLFCRMQLIQTIIIQTSTSAATAVYAQGDIKHYAIYKSITNSLPVLLTFLCFSLGGSPIWLYIPMIVVWAIGGNIVIVRYANKKCSLSTIRYIKETLMPIMGVLILMISLGMIPKLTLLEGFLRLILCGFVTTLGLIIALSTFGLKTNEKIRILKLLPLQKCK